MMLSVDVSSRWQVMSTQPFQNILNPWYFMYQVTRLAMVIWDLLVWMSAEFSKQHVCVCSQCPIGYR